MREKDSYIRECGASPECNFPKPIKRSRRALVHDGRQPWRIRRQQVLGTCPNRMDHRRSLLHLLAPRPHRHPLAAAPRAGGERARRRHQQARQTPAHRSSGRRLFAFDRRLGVRFVAGADEAGRGCLAGPLVAAGVLFDYDALDAARAALAERAERLQAAHRRGARGAVPARAAQRRARRRGLAVCAHGRRARAAQDQPRRPARRAARRHRRGARRGAVPRRRLLGGRLRAPAARDRRRRRHAAPRSRRPRSSPR